MIRRTGVTLIEVLVAIFVTSIGLLALLALFPLGAVNMAEMIRNGRAALAAIDGAANIRVWQISQPHPQDLPPSYAPIHNDYFVTLAYGGKAVYAGQLPLSPPKPDGPSYAVFVDPLGFESYSAVSNFSQWVAGGPGIPPVGPGIPRQTVSVFNPSPLPPGTIFNPNPKPLVSTFDAISVTRRATMLRWFSLLDDIAFGTDGLPGPVERPPSERLVQRENRYSWAYLLRRPRFSDPSVVEMTIAVYDRRVLQLGGASLLPVGETAYPVEISAANTVNLVYAGGLPKPSLRAGGWILDATPLPGHGYFYRVVSVSDTVTAQGKPAVQVELQDNIRTVNVVNNARVPVFSQAVVMDNLVEVFERGPVAVP